MRKDPTEFRKRFAAWKNGKQPYKGGRPSAISEVDKSDADFAERLRSNWRQETWDWEGSGKAVTHKIGSADNIVYPNVQTTKGGGLIDFTNPIWKGVVDPLNRAIINKDYVPMKTEQDAIWFGPNYKEYYPKFKDGKLPGYEDGDKPITVGEYKVYPSAIGASELNVTTPEIVITGNDKRPMYQRYAADSSTYDPELITNFTGLIPVIGEVQDATMAVDAYNKGDYLSAGMLGAGLVLPNIIKSPSKYIIKAGLKHAPEFTKNLYDISRLYITP